MKTNEARLASRLVEVWGDTADTGHLAWSILIGGGVSIVGFLVASRLLAGLVATPELARAYAMLAGLAGCLLAGVICAILFRPKREVTEDDSGDPSWREEVLDKLAAESGGLGSVADLPAAAVREMQELELFELFESRERHSAGIEPIGNAASPAAPAASTVPIQSTAT
ncbi:conserved protein of unknown function [Cupriavidus taiwanensis]|uniref:hypothetical protein n=1 Tax=Cupriavidus taiwanensis TaxID=164546 RepID=UPI000E1052CC|nr:hypothetical protein [Cupriavidus taiwanensis]SPA42911.1 conserved protein of unknown function [Cupriavidus taiwanensis]